MEQDQGLTILAVEYWRLLRLYERAITEQPPNKHMKGIAQHRYASKKLTTILSQYGLYLIAYEGQEYSPNLPVTVVNGDEFDDNEGLVIEQTIDPTVIKDGHVYVTGKVVLKKGE